jgi:TonB family protein
MLKQFGMLSAVNMKFLAKIGFVIILGTTLTPAQNAREFLQHLVGQRFILRHYAGLSSGECDLAIEVTSIAFKKSSIRVQARNIGTPTTGNKSGLCANVDEFTFQINGFDLDQSRDRAEKIVGSVLMTPEAYLAALGIPWNPPASSESESPVDISRPGLGTPRVLLFVNPYYPGASRLDRSEGTVTVSCVIGTDGRVHGPIVVKGVTKELNKLALDALTFYRSQPTRDGDRAVAVRTSFEFSFKLN